MSVHGLPGPVVERLGSEQLAVVTRDMSGQREWRRAAVECRTADDGTVSVHGYATVYDYPYDVAGGPSLGGWTETIAAGACRKSVAERDDVRMYFDHAGLVLARTASRTLRLESDDVGLLVDATIDPALSVASDVVVMLTRGDVDAMSFAFRALRQEWNADYTSRLIREVQLYDVSIVGEPANPATVVALRSDDRIEVEPGPGRDIASARMIVEALKLKTA